MTNLQELQNYPRTKPLHYLHPTASSLSVRNNIMPTLPLSLKWYLPQADQQSCFERETTY